jgi:hypothetical protein
MPADGSTGITSQRSVGPPGAVPGGRAGRPLMRPSGVVAWKRSEERGARRTKRRARLRRLPLAISLPSKYTALWLLGSA